MRRLPTFMCCRRNAQGDYHQHSSLVRRAVLPLLAAMHWVRLTFEDLDFEDLDFKMVC
jgi:hypothetical protein